jgi:DNA-binding beta-propeller fold protein YncE/4-amino-4-deoxy-L-arabinose transferase-like glycosyltransferase
LWARIRSAWTAETVALAVLLLVALLARLIVLGTLPDTMTADEADNARDAIHILNGNGPGFFGLDWKPAPAFNVYLIAAFFAVFGQSLFVLRLPAVLGSIMGLVFFYLFARHTLSRPASFFATALLAFSLWHLHFSRSGWENIQVILFTAGAGWALVHGLRRGQLRWFALAGVFCALGWYGYFAGRFILVALLAYLPFALRWSGLPARRLVVGYGVLLGTAFLLYLPQIPVIIRRWDYFNRRVEAVFILNNLQGAPLVGLANHLLRQLRGFILLDGGVFDGTSQTLARYIPVGRPLLDPITGTLYVIGLVIGVARFRATALWWCLFGVPLLGTQWLSSNTPDPARAIGILPVMLLFVGLVFDQLPWRGVAHNLAQLALLALVPVATILNLRDYLQWQADPVAVEARFPAVAQADFPQWAALQAEWARERRTGFSVIDWLAMRRELGPPVAGAPAILRQISSSPLSATLEAVYGAPGSGPGQLLDPHGLAVDQDGNVYIADSGNARVLKFDPAGRLLLTFGNRGTGDAQFDQPWALAFDRAQNLYVLDAMTGQIQRFDRDGRFQARFGAEVGMFRPRGLAIGPGDELLVADTGHDRIIGLSPDGQLRFILGKPQAQISQPTSAIRDRTGALIVAEPDVRRVQRLGADGRRLDQWAIERSDTFNAPHFALLPDDRLLMTNPAQRRLEIYAVDLRTAQFIQFVASETVVPFEAPVAVTVGPDGAVYVLDARLAQAYRLRLP